MQLINKKSTVIAEQRNGTCTVTITSEGFYFSKNACMVFGLSEGEYLQFLNDANVWTFFKNNDPDGFELINKGSRKKEYGLMINSRPLVRVFKKQTGYHEIPKTFLLFSTDVRYNDLPVVEINTHKPWNKIGKEILTHSFENVHN